MAIMPRAVIVNPIVGEPARIAYLPHPRRAHIQHRLHFPEAGLLGRAVVQRVDVASDQPSILRQWDDEQMAGIADEYAELVARQGCLKRHVGHEVLMRILGAGKMLAIDMSHPAMRAVASDQPRRNDALVTSVGTSNGCHDTVRMRDEVEQFGPAFDCDAEAVEQALQLCFGLALLDAELEWIRAIEIVGYYRVRCRLECAWALHAPH